MVILKTLLALTAVSAATVCTVCLLPSLLKESCVPFGKPCSVRSHCCNAYKPYRIGMYFTKGQCFIFGNSTCQPIDKIPNAIEFIKLRGQLNGTNFAALRKKYWKSVR